VKVDDANLDICLHKLTYAIYDDHVTVPREARDDVGVPREAHDP